MTESPNSKKMIVSVMCDTEGTGKVDELKIVDAVRQIFKLTPAGLIEQLNLRRPIYRQTAAMP